MITGVGEGKEKLEPSHIADGNIKLWKIVWQFLNMLNIEFNK